MRGLPEDCPSKGTQVSSYRSLSAEAQSVAAAHVDELVRLGAAIIRSGIVEGTFRHIDPVTASQAILFATARFHHPAHAMEWADPKLDTVFDDVWRILMQGLSADKDVRRRKSG